MFHTPRYTNLHRTEEELNNNNNNNNNNKVTRKITKRMKKRPFFGDRFSINFLFKNKNRPLPSTHSISQWAGFFNTNVDGETCTTVLSVFLGLVPTSKIYIFVSLYDSHF